MTKWLIILIIMNFNANSIEESIGFSDKDSTRYELKQRGNQGQGLFKNGKFVKFYPIVSRDDVETLINDLSKFSISDSEKNDLQSKLYSNYEKGLNPATDAQLIETAFALSKLAEDSLAEKEVECNEENGINSTVKNKETKEESIYCECNLPKNSEHTIVGSVKAPSFDGEYWDDYSILGEIESSSFSIDTTNDNHLHGLLSKLGGSDLDGNDRGRTFGMNLDYSLIGSEGEFRVNFESVIFTQLHEAGDNKFYVNESGEFLQDLLERNRLDVSLRRLLDKDRYFIAGVELEELSDNGSVAGPIQKSWHKVGKSIHYDNQSFRDDEINLTVYGGIGKEWMKDLGNWKCTTKVEGTIGQNILDFGDSYIKARAEIELNSNELFGGTEKNPFVLISAWTEGSLETEGEYEAGAGIDMSFPTQVGKWEITPSIGLSLKDEKEDRYFSQEQSSKLEPESHIGITFTRKF